MVYISPKLKKRIILALLLIVVLLILFFVFFLRAPKNVPTQQTPTPVVETPITTETEPQVTEEERRVQQEQVVSQASVRAAATSFTERYGSYSTEANFANLEDVLPLMTEALAAETALFIEVASVPSEYYAVSTSVLTVSIESLDEELGVSEVVVTTQRVEAKGTVQNESVFYQDLALSLVWESGGWLIDASEWL